MNRKFTYVFGLCAITTVLLVTTMAQAAVVLDLTGRGTNTSSQIGEKGLFLGNISGTNTVTCFGASASDPRCNYSWNPVEMAIQANGDATISGTMTRDFEGQQWGVNINLSNVEYKDSNGVYRDGGNYMGGVTGQNILDVAAGIDAFSGVAVGGSGWGFEWQSLDMTVTNMSSNPSVTPATGWIGLSGHGHNFVSELHSNNGGLLTFDAWYQNPTSSSSYFNFGDSKAYGDVTAVPVPSAFWLFSTAMLVVGLSRRAIDWRPSVSGK